MSSGTDLILLVEDNKMRDWNQVTRRWWLPLLPLGLKRSWDFSHLKDTDQKDLFLLLKETETLYSDSKQYLKKERKNLNLFDSCFAKVPPSSPWSSGEGETAFHKKSRRKSSPSLSIKAFQIFWNYNSYKGENICLYCKALLSWVHICSQ